MSNPTLTTRDLIASETWTLFRAVVQAHADGNIERLTTVFDEIESRLDTYSQIMVDFTDLWMEQSDQAYRILHRHVWEILGFHRLPDWVTVREELFEAYPDLVRNWDEERK